MSTSASPACQKDLVRLLEAGTLAGLSDRQLLDEFLTRPGGAGEAALTALVNRHAPMVLRVCTDVLRNTPDAHDAFQTTFLVLIRQAASIRQRDSVRSWLFGVARRVAVQVKIDAARRRRIEQKAAALRVVSDHVEADELRSVLAEELARLPEKYRAPVLLCDLEGLTYDAAARELGCPAATVGVRLMRARDRLRGRLTRRGIALSPALFAGWADSRNAQAGVPASLVARVVESASQHAGLGAGATFAPLGGPALRTRIATRGAIAFGVLLAVGAALTFTLGWSMARDHQTSQLGDAADKRPPQARDQEGVTDTVDFLVVEHGTRKPLEGVKLKLWVNGKPDAELITGKSGNCMIRVAEKGLSRLTVVARHEGFATSKVFLRHEVIPNQEIPRSYTLAMHHATIVGGVVRDQEGRPIEGVEVGFSTSWPREGREDFVLDEEKVRTDSQGRWRAVFIPSGMDLGELHLSFEHPKYLDQTEAVNLRTTASAARLRDGTALTTLRRGFVVTGRVVDAGGRPIAGARVRLGNRFEAQSRQTKTNEAGRFRIENAEPRESTLTVQAEGRSPAMTTILPDTKLAPVEFRLEPGRTIRGRVVDRAGKPVAGASVGVDLWRGSQNLDWRTDTDAEGRFRWNEAPGDGVTIGVGKHGYSSVNNISIRPSDQEAVITLAPGAPLRLKGSVVDAETEKPVPGFRIVPGVIGGDPIWLLDQATPFRDGRYQIAPRLGNDRHLIRIESDGYLPVVSPVFGRDSGEHVFDARLVRGPWLEGTVKSASGGVVAGAEVIVVTVHGISISGGKFYQREHHPHALTGAAGRFSISPPIGEFRIVALHDQGYAEVTGRQFEPTHELRLQPWGRIEGTLRVGGRLMPSELVEAHLDDQRLDPEEPIIQNGCGAMTDERGHFRIEHVAPGEASVYWQPDSVTRAKSPTRFYQPAFVMVEAGREAHVDLVQAGGRSLIGRLSLPAEFGPLPEGASWKAYITLAVPEPPYPPDLPEANRQGWLSRWRLTEPATRYRRHQRGFAHSLNLGPDHSFRIDEVQPGRYVLHAQVRGRLKGQQQQIASLTHEFGVAPGAGSASSPVDLGTLTLQGQEQVAPGAD